MEKTIFLNRFTTRKQPATDDKIIMKKKIFRLLARINQHVLPSYGERDLSRLSKLDKLIIAYRYYVTKNAL